MIEIQCKDNGVLFHCAVSTKINYLCQFYEFQNVWEQSELTNEEMNKFVIDMSSKKI